MEKQKAQTIKPWEAAARAGVATVLAAGMAGTPVVALADGEAEGDRGGFALLAQATGITTSVTALTGCLLISTRQCLKATRKSMSELDLRIRGR